MVYIDQLKDLREKRLKLSLELHLIGEHIIKAESGKIVREHQIKVEFEHEVQRAIAEIAKVKYSNAERRKVELDKKYASDLTLNEFIGSLEQFNKCERRLECDLTLLKLEERYLFKEIDIYIAMKNFENAQIRTGL